MSRPSRGRLANDAWEALLVAYGLLIKEFGADDIWDQVSMREYDVLYTLSKCAGPVRVGELGRHVLLSQPALSRLVDRLVDRGLLVRTPDPADRRGVMVVLTEVGSAEQRRVGGRHAIAVANRVGGRLSPDELAALERLCRKLAGDDEEGGVERGALGQNGSRDGADDRAVGTDTCAADGGRAELFLH